MGPISVPDTASTHVVALGAFLHPLPAWTHEVRIRGGVFSDLLDDTYDVSFIQEDFTYTVVVA